METGSKTDTGQEENTMKITAGGATFTAALADNSSVEALKELLAKGHLTIHMSGRHHSVSGQFPCDLL